jgi:hypothetical protein
MKYRTGTLSISGLMYKAIIKIQGLPIISVKNPAPRAQGVKVKLNTVILRLDRGIHFLSLDCPIKSGNDKMG